MWISCVLPVNKHSYILTIVINYGEIIMHSLPQDQLTTLSLKEVGAAFEQWRTTRAKKSKIP